MSTTGKGRRKKRSALCGVVSADWRSLTGEQFLQTRKALGLTQPEIAAELGVSNKTVMRWETQPETLPPLAKIVLSAVRNSLEETPASPDISTTSQLLKKIRKEQGLTRRDLAELLGVSLSCVDKWMSGETKAKGPALICLRLIACYGPCVPACRCKGGDISISRGTD